MSSRYSMFVRRYRGGLTFRRGIGGRLGGPSAAEPATLPGHGQRAAAAGQARPSGAARRPGLPSCATRQPGLPRPRNTASHVVQLAIRRAEEWRSGQPGPAAQYGGPGVEVVPESAYSVAQCGSGPDPVADHPARPPHPLGSGTCRAGPAVTSQPWRTTQTPWFTAQPGLEISPFSASMVSARGKLEVMPRLVRTKKGGRD